MADEENAPTGAEKRAAIRKAAPEKAAATRQAQRAATKKAAGSKPKKVKVRMRTASRTFDAGAIRHVDPDIANDLVANSLAVLI